MIPQALRDRIQWLVWRLESKPGAKKPAKMPYYVSGARRTGEQGSVSDRSQLTTFDFAMEAMSRGRYDGVGFAFLPDDGLIGIDLDNAYAKVTDPDGVVTRGDLRMGFGDIIASCQSFTEFSPSGFGLHIYAFGKTQTFKSNDIGVEVFCGAQFFTVTGDQLLGTPDQVNDLSPQALELLRGMVDQAKEQRQAAAAASGGVAVQRRTAAPRPAATPVSSLDNDFTKVNAAALGNFDAWVPALFPAAKRHAGGYRVPQKSLGRDLQEDLSIHVDGIVDYGVHDQGDPRQGKRTPIDLVMEWGGQQTPKDALHWLAGRLGIDVSRRESRSTSRAPSEGGAPPDGDVPIDGGEGPPDDDGRPIIRWVAGNLPAIVDEAEIALLARTVDQLYQRAGQLVRVVRRDVPSVRNYKRPPGVLGIVTVDKPYLVEEFTRCARWEKYDERMGKKYPWRKINAPEQVASTYLSRTGQWRVPHLWSTLSAPTLRPDGTVLQQRGYDPGMRAFYDPGGVEYPVIPDKPTRADAKACLDRLKKAISTFPFATEVDRSVALAMMLTGLVRRSLPSAPLGAITAPGPSSGKTLLADFIAIMCMGATAPAMKYADTDEEAAKIAMAVLLEGDPVVLIDNVERPLGGDWLCTMITSETYKGRILGLSQMGNLSTNCVWLATGNQIALIGDLTTRALLCRIDPKMERPAERVFTKDLREWAMEHRPALVAAGLMLMRAFVASGESPREYVHPWGRFEHWTDLVRAPLVWLGEQDPCASLSALEAEDLHRQEHLRVLHAWHQHLGEEVFTARELIDRLSGVMPEDKAYPLKELIRDLCEDRQGIMKPKRLSPWLRKYAGRRVEGLQLLKVDEKDHTAIWKVEKVNEVDG